MNVLAKKSDLEKLLGLLNEIEISTLDKISKYDKYRRVYSYAYVYKIHNLVTKLIKIGCTKKQFNLLKDILLTYSYTYFVREDINNICYDDVRNEVLLKDLLL